MKCPSCGYEIPTYRELLVTKEERYYPVYKCQNCEFIFAVIRKGRLL